MWIIGPKKNDLIADMRLVKYVLYWNEGPLPAQDFARNQNGHIRQFCSRASARAARSRLNRQQKG